MTRRAAQHTMLAKGDARAVQASPFAPPTALAGGARWTHLHGAARAIAVTELARAAPGLVVVIAPEPRVAQRLDLEIPFFAPGLALFHFPDWETLPYDRFSPYQDIVSERLTVLNDLPHIESGVLVLSVSAMLQRLPPRSWVLGASFALTQGQRIDREQFRERLQQTGYRSVSQVMDHGEFAVRGSLIDVFPMGSEEAFRIDLFGDEIDTLRVFEPETQRSIRETSAIKLLPGREISLSEEGVAEFRRQWRDTFSGHPNDSPLYQDVCAGVAPPGVEYYLPLFYAATETIFDYLPDRATVVSIDDTATAADQFLDTVSERYEQLRHDNERPILAPPQLYLDLADYQERAARYPQIEISTRDWSDTEATNSFATKPAVKLPIDARAAEPLAPLKSYMRRFSGRILIAAESSGRRETISELLRHHDVAFEQLPSWQAFLDGDARMALTVAEVAEGVEISEPAIAIVTESQLFGDRAAQSRRRRRSNVEQEAIVRNLAELTIGAPVVHEDHGVGRYLGLQALDVDEASNEFITLAYADDDKLYVPVTALHLISRFSGIDPEHAPLHKLGSGQWDRAKRKATARIRDVAAELLEIHARRAARTRPVFTLDADGYRAFKQSFPFEETPDQEAAITAVEQDLVKLQPMDRLICGDVGFGKTEVAMRAAFIVADSGHQVAVLVPTTLLAQQHYQTFRDRFADWPIRIEMLSRFRDRAATASVLEDLASGVVDIVIGTHKLLGRDIKFKRLGLIVIDEEHRFGVRQKEKFKALRSEIDVLTLTATPIPRTLNMALSGTRELSVIATPPSKRLAIKTFVREWSKSLIREALMRELSRGGQVYFVHNEVETIATITREVQQIVPQARVRFAHGQMRERDLEQVMLDFYHQRCNVLVCTTIIETGIDVPSANTIVINRADKFGLAQLYQLRGRVGRSHHRAYAYLLIPHPKSMTADAVKRLDAIEALEDLGVGFTLATHDMEIRGAGEILGEEQSGHIQQIGFGLYSEMLNRAVAALKAGHELDFDRDARRDCDVELHIPALFPEDYLPDVHTRLVLYKRIASAAEEETLTSLKEEVVDRFGVYDAPVRNLFRMASLRMRARTLGVRLINLGSTGGRFEFYPQPDIEPMNLLLLLQHGPGYRMDGEEKLKIRKEFPDADARIDEVEYVLQTLAGRQQK